MTIDPVMSLPSVTGTLPTAQAQAKSQTDFAGWLNQQIADTNHQILTADTQLRKLAVGEAGNLHQVMMSLEKAKLSFNLVVQVQNKLVQAYQDVMRMQV